MLWAFNSVKHLFAAGGSKKKGEQAPLPTQEILFSFSSASAAGGCNQNFYSARSMTQRRDCFKFLFQKWGNFKIIEGNKNKNEKQNWNNFDNINFMVSVWKGKRRKTGKSLCVHLSWFWWVSHLFFFKILICDNNNFSLKSKFQFSDSSGNKCGLGFFLEKKIPFGCEVKCLLLKNSTFGQLISK